MDTLQSLIDRFETLVWEGEGNLAAQERVLWAYCRSSEFEVAEVLADDAVADETLARAMQRECFGREVFAELFERRYKDQMLRWFRCGIRDEHRCEDLYQQVCVRLVVQRGINTFDPCDCFRGWLFGVVRHKTIDELRRTNREIPLGDDDPDGPDDVERAVIERELTSRLAEALERLPKEQREVMRSTLEGLSRSEIANNLGIEVARVDRILHTARRAVAHYLGLPVPASNSGRTPREASVSK